LLFGDGEQIEGFLVDAAVVIIKGFRAYREIDPVNEGSGATVSTTGEDLLDFAVFHHEFYVLATVRRLSPPVSWGGEPASGRAARVPLALFCLKQLTGDVSGRLEIIGSDTAERVHLIR
jgi:hypothetical protein